MFSFSALDTIAATRVEFSSVFYLLYIILSRPRDLFLVVMRRSWSDALVEDLMTVMDVRPTHIFGSFSMKYASSTCIYVQDELGLNQSHFYYWHFADPWRKCTPGLQWQMMRA